MEDALKEVQRAVRLGARWDDASENQRFKLAKQEGLVEYVEVNFPISETENPLEIGLPILAHTSNNPICSAFGYDIEIASRVRDGANAVNSPWVGEHLAMLGCSETGALGYVINPLFIEDFAETAVQNVLSLTDYYGRPIALELGPLYTPPDGPFLSELDFLGSVATRANAGIILDLTHWTISNKNLGRQLDFGLDHLPAERVIELHIAGMRQSSSGDLWHDAHGANLSEEILRILTEVLPRFFAVEAVTLEHSIERPDRDFLTSLELTRNAMNAAGR
ncbi:DUF692 family multinuclear iron-containing protein [Sphingomonas sp. ABOLH]|uniref:multinuclear nonheme iron-dependent oxidase n=1 Tax=Sphingomonas sp. ABOLH TaxID=1985881 RepID=UPI000F7E8D43|nr:DUF692 family multinuclear iron-containing protein [Sphingomonas sp. ABOLH]RSV22290.1 DUF692 family protein [Sphingomonas sp. ABOLH]